VLQESFSLFTLVQNNPMKSLTIFICAVLFAFGCKNAEQTPQETKVAAAATTIPSFPVVVKDTSASQNALVANSQPAEMHKMMNLWNGAWSGEVTMWETEGAPPVKSNATVVNKMVLGNRYQQSSFKSTYKGKPFEGIGTLAYDNARKLFLSTWIDNIGTGLMTAEGPWDPASKSITFRGTMTDPATGKLLDTKEIFKPIDNNYQVMEMYAVAPDGKEFKTMEIKYTRKN
jgi:hypothetical protein